MADITLDVRELDGFPLAKLPLLLTKDTTLPRFFALIPCREALVRALLAAGLTDKYQALSLDDATLSAKAGLSMEQAALLRALLHLHDFRNRMLAELDSVSPSLRGALAADGVTSSRDLLALARASGTAAIARRYCVPTEESARLLGLCDLMRLPGVRCLRASLYYDCGLSRMQSFIGQDADDLRQHIGRTIQDRRLACATPLRKELATQIAVATLLPKL